MEKSKKNKLITASIAGLLAVGSVAAMNQTAFAEDAAGKVPCYGVNACKGTGECGGKGHACAGKNACKGAGSVMMDKEACTAAGGTLKAAE